MSTCNSYPAWIQTHWHVIQVEFCNGYTSSHDTVFALLFQRLYLSLNMLWGDRVVYIVYLGWQSSLICCTSPPVTHRCMSTVPGLNCFESFRFLMDRRHAMPNDIWYTVYSSPQAMVPDGTAFIYCMAKLWEKTHNTCTWSATLIISSIHSAKPHKYIYLIKAPLQ